MHDVAHDLDLKGCIHAFPEDGQHHARARLAAHALNGFGQGKVLGQHIIDLDDQIAGLQARAITGGVLDRRHDTDTALGRRDLDANAAELTARIDLHFLVHLLVQIGRVRIEVCQHALKRAIDELLVADLLDVRTANKFHDLGKLLQLTVIRGRLGLLIAPLRIPCQHCAEHHQCHPGAQDQTTLRCSHPVVSIHSVCANADTIASGSRVCRCPGARNTAGPGCSTPCSRPEPGARPAPPSPQLRDRAHHYAHKR